MTGRFLREARLRGFPQTVEQLAAASDRPVGRFLAVEAGMVPVSLDDLIAYGSHGRFTHEDWLVCYAALATERDALVAAERAA